jgi:hypothetical protein
MYAQQILQHSYTYVKYSLILLTLTQQKTAHQVCIKIWDEETKSFSIDLSLSVYKQAA